MNIYCLNENMHYIDLHFILNNSWVSLPAQDPVAVGYSENEHKAFCIWINVNS